MALLSTVAFSIWATLLKYNPVGKVSIFGFSIPVFGVALSALVLKEEIFTFQNLAALLLVSVGIIVVNIAGEKEN
jgi:drug/metabolite transporter (DMT)-like permease